MNNKMHFEQITAIIIVSFIVVLTTIFFGINGKINKVITLEESIVETKANITLVENARNQKVVNLVDTIKSYNDYESSTLETIIEARKLASDGKVEQAGQLISLIVEKYPDLKSQDNYKLLMNEISISENSVADARKTYNGLVKEYNSYNRKFINKIMLGVGGYEKVDFEPLSIETDSNLNNIWD